jgi:hypothetical protein
MSQELENELKEIKRKKRDLKDDLRKLTMILMDWNISFYPPISGERLENVKKFNPKGYKAFTEYMRLDQEEREVLQRESDLQKEIRDLEKENA